MAQILVRSEGRFKVHIKNDTHTLLPGTAVRTLWWFRRIAPRDSDQNQLGPNRQTVKQTPIIGFVSISWFEIAFIRLKRRKGEVSEETFIDNSGDQSPYTSVYVYVYVCEDWSPHPAILYSRNITETEETKWGSKTQQRVDLFMIISVNRRKNFERSNSHPDKSCVNWWIPPKHCQEINNNIVRTCSITASMRNVKKQNFEHLFVLNFWS